MHNRDKAASQQRKSSNHEQKHHSTKIKEEHMNKTKDPTSMYSNQMGKASYPQQYDAAVIPSNKTVVQSQKYHQKAHNDKSSHNANLQNSLSPSPHMVTQNQNPMNTIPSQANNLLNANNPLNQNMMQSTKNNNALAVEQQTQHHIQNTHHQADLTGNTTPNTELKQHTSPTADIPSMGVYTPDSTTNSVHSLHHYGQCDLDVAQLGLECK